MILRIPTNLSDLQIQEYIKIHEETCGEKISKEEAKQQALSLLRFVALVIFKDEK